MTATITSARELVERYYGLIDTGQLHEASLLMTEDVKLTFANAAPVFGQEAAESSIKVVLDRCSGIKHTVVTWLEEANADGGTTAFFEIRIRYELKNGKVLDNPGAVVATVGSDGRFTEQRLYGDLHEVFVD